jgi:hypothetical protein
VDERPLSYTSRCKRNYLCGKCELESRPRRCHNTISAESVRKVVVHPPRTHHYVSTGVDRMNTSRVYKYASAGISSQPWAECIQSLFNVASASLHYWARSTEAVLLSLLSVSLGPRAPAHIPNSIVLGGARVRIKWTSSKVFRWAASQGEF